MTTSDMPATPRSSLLNRLLPSRQWLGVVVATTAGLAYLTLFEQGTPPVIDSWMDDSSGKTQPDAHIETLTLRQFGDDGRLQFQIISPHARHYPKDDSTHFDTPEVDYFDEKSRWRSTAQEGVMSNANNSVFLQHDVVLRQLDKAATMTTDKLFVFVDQKIAMTDSDVTIETNGGKLQGKGLAADFNQQTLKLLSNVQGIYETTHR